MNILQFKTANCKNCYKCVRYCPVKSIKIEKHQAKIIESDCILCGNCTTVCPQNAKEDISDIPKIKEIIGKKEIIASVAPSYIAYFNTGSFDEFTGYLKRLGITQAFETAWGAYAVKTQYEKNEKQMGDTPVISSCCPTVNLYIRKYRPDAIKYLSPVKSPMQAHVKMLREKFSQAAVIFISPCISKKAECARGEGADFCVTFDELESWFEEKNITLDGQTNGETQIRFSRQFPLSGGILSTMRKENDRKYLSASGFESICSALDEILSGGLKGCFIEMNACTDGCIGGPSFRKKKIGTLSSRIKVINTAGNDYEQDFKTDIQIDLDKSFSPQEIYKPKPSERRIEAILKKMGKHSAEDELNCGMCGYSSCREKAVAVYEGKAEISMCLPFMKERAESISDNILNIMPNAVLAVDTDLKIQQINAAACELFKVKAENITGANVSEILDEYDFVDMLTNDKREMTKHSYIAEYGAYLEQEFRFDKPSGIIICTMKNITEARRRQNSVMKAKVQAANMADEIVENQLNTVHEIAALLGETAARTKAAVHNLKETIMMDSEDDSYE